MCDHVFGPFIFVENTINRQDYMEVLENFFFPQLEESDFASRIILQHDGRLPHFTRHAVEVLTAAFPGRWIGRGGSVLLPSESLVLTI
jgi:hypothetical protein